MFTFFYFTLFQFFNASRVMKLLKESQILYLTVYFMQNIQGVPFLNASLLRLGSCSDIFPCSPLVSPLKSPISTMIPVMMARATSLTSLFRCPIGRFTPRLNIINKWGNSRCDSVTIWRLQWLCCAGAVLKIEDKDSSSQLRRGWCPSRSFLKNLIKMPNKT